MAGEPLTRRALNRATLARQLLLSRSARPAFEAIEHLVGLQAQNPRDPYLGLLARLENFEPAELSRALAERHAVRMPLLRATLHLATAADGLALRAVLDPVLARTFGSTAFAKAIAGVDRSRLLAAGRALLEKEPRTRAALAQALAQKFRGRDGGSLAQAVTYLLPSVQIPPRGLWDGTGQATWAPAEHWLGQPLPPPATPDGLVLRYLAAFGPASLKDVRAWSGLAGLGDVMARLGPRLRTFCSPDGTALFDLPDAPRPDPDTPAPPRLLPEYDNLLLGHADRSRFFVPGIWPPGWAGNVLLDGFYAGWWKSELTSRAARLAVQPQRRLAPDEKDALVTEATRLLATLAPAVADRAVVIQRARREARSTAA